MRVTVSPISDCTRVTEPVAAGGTAGLGHGGMSKEGRGDKPKCLQPDGGFQPPPDTAIKAQSQITHTQNLP